MHAIVTALVEYVLRRWLAINESSLFEIGKKMLRRVAVDNQENGRREFTSKNVACALGATPEELGLWSRLDLDHDHGVALTATLAKQSDKAPAQYQFKHLSFQEGLYAEHLLLLVTSLTPPNGNGWPGWASDKTASEFLNNRYMNNTCRIAAGHLGALLGEAAAQWDFREHPLTVNGRSALWFITDENDMVQTINVAQNDVGVDDVPGLAKTITTCSNLQKLDLSDNELVKLTVVPSVWWQTLCEAFSGNSTLTDLNLNNNKLGPIGVRVARAALRGTVGLKRLGFSYNEPGVEPPLADLLRFHPALVSVELVEALDRHLPSRAKDDIGRALLENKAKTLGFLHCDTFVLSEETTSLTWPKEASTSDAVLLAGVLVTNTVLTTFNIAPGATLANTARSAMGEALLNNPGSRVAFCNDFGLAAEGRHVRVRPLAHGAQGRRALPAARRLPARQPHADARDAAPAAHGADRHARARAARQRDARAARHHPHDAHGRRVDRAPARARAQRLARAGRRQEGRLGEARRHVADLHRGQHRSRRVRDDRHAHRREHGARVPRPLEHRARPRHRLRGRGRPHPAPPAVRVEDVVPEREINLNNIQLNDKAGAKLFSALAAASARETMGYEKITSLSVANNDLGKQSAAALKQLLWGERAPCNLKSLDLSGNVGLDGYDTALAIKRNESLTSVDFRDIPSANTEEIYTFLGSPSAAGGVHVPARLPLVRRLPGRRRPGGARASSRQRPSRTPPARRRCLASSTETKTRADVARCSCCSRASSSSTTRSSTLTLADTGLDDASGAFFATALVENKVLEHLDISATRSGSRASPRSPTPRADHPALESIKVDGAALPIAQLRGAKGAEATGSTLPTGASARSRATPSARSRAEPHAHSNLNLKSTRSAPTASRRSCRASATRRSRPRRHAQLDRRRQQRRAAIKEALERHLPPPRLAGRPADGRERPRLPGAALAPLCKLRNLRTLSSRRTGSPSCRRSSARCSRCASSPALQPADGAAALVLPAHILETLDLHKNLCARCRTAIGNMKALQKLDVSENKLVELPMSICELNEELQLSVAAQPAREALGRAGAPGHPIGALLWLRVREVEGGSDLSTIPNDDCRDGCRLQPSGGRSSSRRRRARASRSRTVSSFSTTGCRGVTRRSRASCLRRF